MLKTLLAGTGIGAEMYAPIIKAHPLLDPACVISRDIQRAKAVKKEFGFKSYSDNWLSEIDRKDIDAVFICTPTYTHFEIAKSAILAGKHVFLAPPMTIDSSEAEELTTLAEQHNVCAVVDHQRTYQPARKYVQQLIADNYVGKLQQIERIYRNKTHISHQVDHLWKWKTSSGGGVMGLQLTQDVDFLLRVAGGMHTIDAKTISRVEERFLPDGSAIDFDAEDSFDAHISFHNGISAQIQANFATPGRAVDEFIFYGSKGVLILSNETDIIGFSYKPDSKRDRLAIPPGFQIHSVPGSISFTSSYYMADLFTAAIFHESAISPTFDEALHVQRVIDAAKQSADLNHAVEIGTPPERQTSSPLYSDPKEKKRSFVTKIYE